MRHFLHHLSPIRLAPIRRIRPIHSVTLHSSAQLIMPSSHKFSNDQIFIDRLNLKCTCGPNAFGRIKPQPVSLSVWLGTSIARAAASDRVDLSIDYSELTKRLTKMDEGTSTSVVALLDKVTELALSIQGTGKVCVKVDLDKGLLRARNVQWERNAWVDNGVKGEWKCLVQGVQVPIIIGIVENIHERTQKQIVIIDLQWHGYEGTAAGLETFPTIDLVNSVIQTVSDTSYESVESLATLIANTALHPSFQNVSVTVRKPNALPFASAAGVHVTRSHQTKDDKQGKEVYIALGSNLGDRVRTLQNALKILSKRRVLVQDVSGLYESEPMYVEEQPQFLNAVCKARTTLSPSELLATLKQIEVDLGRIPTIRNGPRTLDLDILLYGQEIINEKDLIIPHLSMLERGFVIRPLADIAPNLLHPITSSSILSHLKALPPITQHTYLPLRTTSLTFSTQQKTLIMAILNLTPDSFSDGGLHSLDTTDIVKTVTTMIKNGAHIIDIGGSSTRPNAPPVPVEEELNRVIPAIRAIRKAGITTTISIDTYSSTVANAAIQAGADIINDISSGQIDSQMFSVVAKLQCPIILMHIRGTPETMTGLTTYDDIINDVGKELVERVEEALKMGIRRWNILLDPGLGFAKTESQNLEVIRRFQELRQHEGLQGMAWVVGPSRKRFIEKVTGESVPQERIWGTAGAVAGCIVGGAEIVRVHDVGEMGKFVKMCDAIWRVPKN